MDCQLLEDILHENDRFAIVIDGENLHRSARALGLDIDYFLLRETFAQYARLSRACFYTTLPDIEEYSPIRPLVDWLGYNGYNVCARTLKEYTGANGRPRFKGNINIELAVDVMDMCKGLDHIVLFSGNGDFSRLAKALQYKGLRVTVVSTIKTQPPMIADDLRRQADRFLDLQELGPFIARKRRQVALQTETVEA